MSIDQVIDHDFLTMRVKNAWDYRKTTVDTSSCRIIFGEADFYVSNDIAVKLGSRLEHSEQMNKWNVAPRVSLAYKFRDKSQASFAYGIFYQNPESRYQPALPSIGYAKATHYILQYQKTSNVRTFRTEVFYKDYNNLFKTGLDAFGREVATSNNGKGYAKGV